ncbi:MAG: 30S ribosomal protein S16 [Spirochaetales bacterium]|nr:30S ribosomal protein S16 [Spirochaetales bacterium]MCF7937441.1 30S ribosomal protein S16 [Spirochaetales bacterium]
MGVKIRLKRFGTKRRAFYRIVVMDSRAPRDGRAIEEVGFYRPIEVEDQQIVLKEDRIREWLSKGARPTPTVKKLLNKKDIDL